MAVGRRAISLALAAALAAALASAAAPIKPVAAWCNTGITKWSNPTQRLNVLYTVPVGSGWNSAIDSSRNDWNGIDTLTYLTPTFQAQDETNFNLNYSDFSNMGWPAVPAGTVNSSSSVPHSASDVSSTRTSRGISRAP